MRPLFLLTKQIYNDIIKNAEYLIYKYTKR